VKSIVQLRLVALLELIMIELFLVPALLALMFGAGFITSNSDDEDPEADDPENPGSEIEEPDGEDPDGEDPGVDDPIDDPDPQSLPIATQGNDALTITPAMRGTLDAGAGNDTITATGGAEDTLFVVTPFQYAWSTDDAESPLSILGGPGEDVFTLSGQGLEVTTAAGADSVTINGLQNTLIRADDQDTVYGQDSEDLPTGVTDANVYVLIDGAGNFVGGTTNDTVTTTGAGATVHGGGGNDIIRDMGGSASLSGGGGDDRIWSDIREDAFFPSATDSLSFYTGTDSDTLDGGAGNDRLMASHGDRLTGGGGDDSFTLFLREGVTSPAAVITDFVPANEQISIFYGSTDDAQTDANDWAGEITTRLAPSGATEILGDGTVIVVIEGNTNLRVGLALPGGEGPVTTLDGVTRPMEDFDVIVSRYLNVSS